jgi:Chitin binding Peritrophin-A domain
MRKIRFLILIFVAIIEINAQISTAPTAGPTEPLTTTPVLTTTTQITTPTPPILPPTVPSATSTASTTTTLPPPPEINCPASGIHHLPTQYCQEFILCIYGRAHPGRCEDGFLFEERSSSCLEAHLVDCGTRQRPLIF